jgi:hypothetical protein
MVFFNFGRSHMQRCFNLKALTAAVALAGLSSLPAHAAGQPTGDTSQNLGDVNCADVNAGI